MHGDFTGKFTGGVVAMATPKKTAEGTWRVQMQINGQRLGGTFATKREADDWMAKMRVESRLQASGQMSTVKTLAQAMERYGEEVTPHKRGWRAEGIRLQAVIKHDKFPGAVKLQQLTAQHLSAWRDARLKLVSRGTVLREMVLIGHVLEVARRDWGWLHVNPMADVRKPAEPDHRERIITGPEIRAMLRTMDWSRRKPVRTVTQAVAHCFVAALQTGMRAGELTGLRWEDVRGDYCTLHAGRTKTGKGRQVPLTSAARRTIELMRGYDDELVFGLKSQTLDAMFRKYRERAGLSGFTFHDSRHTAATRMAQILNVLDLCKVFGWTNATRALTYVNPTGSDLAKRLQGARRV